MAMAMKKKSNSSVNHRNEVTNDHSSLTEERRLLRPNQSKKSIQKYNTLVHHMTSIQIDEELNKRQLSTK